jgi:hypothetical protein
MAKTKSGNGALAPVEKSLPAIPAAAVRAQLHNDWAKVSDEDKLKYAVGVCRSLDIPTPLNPFKFIDLSRQKNGSKIVFYATKEAAELIAERNKISVNVTNKYLDRDQNLYIVEVRASMKDGRTFDNLAAMSVAGCSGQDRANMIMKTVSKAIRRVVFSAVGLSVMDDEDVKAVGDMAYPTPPPIANKALTQQVIESQGQPVTPETKELADETIGLRADLMSRLMNGKFKKGKTSDRVKNVTAWIAENSHGQSLDLMSATDCVELLAILDKEEEADAAQEQLFTEENGNDQTK